MSHSFEERLARFAAEATEQPDFAGTVHECVRFACNTLGTEHGGVTLIGDHGKSFETVGVSSPAVARADQLQYELNEGPCVTAAVESRMVSSADLASDARWPRWGTQVSKWGFHSVISVGLHGRGQRIGALNIYGPEKSQFSADDIEMAHLFAAHASAALFQALNEESLMHALDTRTLIGQAEGMLMERFGLSADQAFAVLRRLSQSGNVKLNDVARDIVTTGSLPPTESEEPR